MQTGLESLPAHGRRTRIPLTRQPVKQLTRCMRTNGLGPRHVLHTMGKSLRSHPASSCTAQCGRWVSEAAAAGGGGGRQQGLRTQPQAAAHHAQNAFGRVMSSTDARSVPSASACPAGALAAAARQRRHSSTHDPVLRAWRQRAGRAAGAKASTTCRVVQPRRHGCWHGRKACLDESLAPAGAPAKLPAPALSLRLCRSPAGLLRSE